jgi:hypothetical protein
MAKKRRLSENVSTTAQIRDEAVVQAHLAAAEARDHFSVFEQRREKLRQNALAAYAILKNTRDEVGSALALARDSLRKSSIELGGLALSSIRGH